MYKEEKSFNVLRGRVPDFSGWDITLAFTVDDQPSSGGFPNKNKGYTVSKVECEGKVTAEWDNNEWALENIQNPENVSKIKCNIGFSTNYKEPILAGTDPILDGDLIPVTIDDDTGTVTVADQSTEWYSYKKKNWANAIIPTSEAKEEVNNYKPGKEIQENQIESYFVWIPKYSYKLFDENMGNYSGITGVNNKKQNEAIRIQFGLENTKDNSKTLEGEECTTPMTDDNKQGKSGDIGQCDVGEWMTHPAFISFDVNGFWVGKFEPSKKSTDKIQIKPGQTSWRSITIGNAFTYSKDYRPNLQSHLMKNTEWGAMAYLTHSIYGKCESNTICSEVSINSGYTTGYTLTTTYANGSKLASTTGNRSGIYDVNGGAWEYMASVMKNSGNKTIAYGNSGLSDNELNDPRYYDVYNYGTTYTDYSRRILGDATGELGPFGTVNSYESNSYFSDNSVFVEPSGSWFVRSGYYLLGSNSGLFAFSRNTGAAADHLGFRVVLAVK